MLPFLYQDVDQLGNGTEFTYCESVTAYYWNHEMIKIVY